MIRQHSRLARAGIALMAVSVVAACSKEPGGQVVAVVNNDEVTQQELREAAKVQGGSVPINLAQEGPAILQQVIDRNVLADYAREQGLDRSPAFVARKRQGEQSLLAALAIEKLVGPQKDPTQSEVAAYIKQHPTLFARREQLRLDQLRFPTPANLSEVKELSKSGSLDLMEAQLRQKGVTVTRGQVVVDTGTLDPSIAEPVAALPPGALFDLSGGGVTLVNVVTQRSPVAGDPGAWQKQAQEAVRVEKVTRLVSGKVKELRKSAKISIAPGYSVKKVP